MNDPATMVRDLLHSELRMCGHEIVDLPAAALVADRMLPVVVVAQGDGTVRIAYDGGEYRSMPAAINWPLLVSALSAVATANRASKKKGE